ncbi:hypothetical protein AAFF_G00365370 [Aldrovandia affinis]|uniref:Uncharacterized protein n=1 Tax=Aldrovandia affinis TaxID=143900 RepID=A0AAD7R751_9TELE|nr:hypothetical protein AAFF_G00365370 [Aldrovandia affinis]
MCKLRFLALSVAVQEFSKGGVLSNARVGKETTCGESGRDKPGKRRQLDVRVVESDTEALPEIYINGRLNCGASAVFSSHGPVSFLQSGAPDVGADKSL